MKKMMSLALALVMCLSLCVPALANESTLGIVESTDEQGRVTRTIQRTARVLADSENNFDEIKQVLLSLGMSQAAVDGLSEERLADYENALEIQSVVEYTKTDEDGNVTYLSEVDALNEVAAVEASRGAISDTYMRISHTAANRGNANYTFTTDATWLTMPEFRGTDSVGSCAMNCTVTPGTQSGSYSYLHRIYNTAGSFVRQETLSGNFSAIHDASNGNFFGSGATFSLPADRYLSSQGIPLDLYSQYNASFTYNGHVNLPNQESYFNSTGTYCHARVTLSFSPSLSISTSGNSGSIGISAAISKDTKDVLKECHYIP